MRLGLDCVIEVRTDDELEAVLELLDPEIFLLSARGSDDEDGFERALELLPDVPAGKLAIAEAHVTGRDEVPSSSGPAWTPSSSARATWPSSSAAAPPQV